MSEPALTVSLDGYEGPLDVLLHLAQSAKVDLREISILELAEQYLAFIERAKALRLELAADYLVMAAWLAYLKSRLLLPEEETATEEESPEQMAARLAWHLERLQRLRDLATQLSEGPLLGTTRFARGAPEAYMPVTRRRIDAKLSDLLRAYLRLHASEEYRPRHADTVDVFSMDQALARLRGLIGATQEWSRLESFLPEGWRAQPERRRSATAATFAAVLEMVRDGGLELRQTGPFEPISLRKRGDNP